MASAFVCEQRFTQAKVPGPPQTALSLRKTVAAEPFTRHGSKARRWLTAMHLIFLLSMELFQNLPIPWLSSSNLSLLPESTLA